MANFRHLAIAIFAAAIPAARAQQQIPGFAVERFYPSAPGAGWFVMDDLNLQGGIGGAIEVSGGYARNPLEVRDSSGKLRALVSEEAFVDVGVAATYRRYRVYLDFPMPVLAAGNDVTLGPYQIPAPALSLGTNPDTIADPRLGFDVLLFGNPGGRLRLGAGAQLIFPSGERSNFLSDARYRGMFRFLLAGDFGPYSYAGQLGVQIRPLNDSIIPGGPDGNELLFGIAAGRKFASRGRWALIVGPEIYGEKGFHSFANNAGAEAQLTARLERTGSGPGIRIKLGAGHAMVQEFGTPEWRLVYGVGLFGRRN
jgi:hypothetical protein